MITDLRTLATGVELAADVCIVGSGPAGLTLASEFAGTKHTVVVLEAGGFQYERATQALYTGEVTGREYPVASSRLRVFGGTSGHWGGQCSPLPPRHMQHRPWVAGRGWPIGPDELAPYYRKAGGLLQLGDVDRDEATLTRLSRQLSQQAEGPLSPWVWRERLAGPLRFGQQLKRQMEEAANISVVLHANVTRLTTTDTANQVKAIRFTTLDGKAGTARARYFVLACGGLEIPRLLLNTDEVQPGGLGNGRGLVGRYFMEHPNGVIGTLFLPNAEAADAIGMAGVYTRDAAPPGGWMPALRLGDAFEQAQKVNGGYYKFAGRPAEWEREWAVWREAPSLRQRLETVARLFDERLYAAYSNKFGYPYPVRTMEFVAGEAAVFVEFEQAPNAESRVTLTRERDQLGLRRLALDWRLSEQDIRTARAMGEAIGRQAYLSGWGRFQFADWMQETGIERSPEFGISFHHIGTTMMASDPQFGVVDAECRVFGCENLYIASSSVCPTASFVNPTQTIVALAYRMADALKARLA